MKLIHYSHKIIPSPDDRSYEQDYRHMGDKPNGLWVSEEELDPTCNWKVWCEGEMYNLEGLKYSHEVVLKDSANILHIKSSEELFNFTRMYPKKLSGWDAEYDTYQLDWGLVKLQYQGIIISPYQWDCRLSMKSDWYYGWDCASGCIWDLSCIESFKFIRNYRGFSSVEEHWVCNLKM